MRAYDSFITVVWNADPTRGTLLFTPKPLPSIVPSKSFFAFSQPFSSLPVWCRCFINACTLHAWLNEMSPRLLVSSRHHVMWNWFLLCCFWGSSFQPCPKVLAEVFMGMGLLFFFYFRAQRLNWIRGCTSNPLIKAHFSQCFCWCTQTKKIEM